LKASTFTYKFTDLGASRLIRTTGVLPTVSRMLWYLLPMVLTPSCDSNCVFRMQFAPDYIRTELPGNVNWLICPALRVAEKRPAVL
jgi:hypothetical protein